MSTERKGPEENFNFAREFRKSIDHIVIDLHRAGKREFDLAVFDDRREFVTQKRMLMIKIGKLPAFPITPQTATAALTIYDLVSTPNKFIGDEVKDKPKNNNELKYAAFKDVYGDQEKQKAFIKVVQKAERLARKLPDKTT